MTTLIKIYVKIMVAAFTILNIKFLTLCSSACHLQWTPYAGDLYKRVGSKVTLWAIVTHGRYTKANKSLKKLMIIPDRAERTGTTAMKLEGLRGWCQ
mgnify:CR=1 FL=1